MVTATESAQRTAAQTITNVQTIAIVPYMVSFAPYFLLPAQARSTPAIARGMASAKLIQNMMRLDIAMKYAL